MAEDQAAIANRSIFSALATFKIKKLGLEEFELQDLIRSKFSWIIAPTALQAHRHLFEYAC